MKKMTKGAIVTGLGVALLLGGGGTLATWNMDQSAGAGTIQSGELKLNVKNETPWKSGLTGEAVTAGHKIVPGEVLTYTQEVEVTKQGDGMKAALKVIGMDGVVDGDQGRNTFGHTLAPTIKVTDTADHTTPLDLASYHGGAYALDEDAQTGTYTVTATLAFNADGQQAMNAALNLDSIRFQLEQQTTT